MMKETIRSLFRVCSLLIACLVFLFAGNTNAQSGSKWVGTWKTAQQLVEPRNMPPSPGLTNNSIRQVVRPSIGGDTIRLTVSNEYSEDMVELKAVKIAVSAGNGEIYDRTSKTLTFSGNTAYTLEPGGIVTSDPIAFNVQPRTDLAITIYYGSTSATATGHPGSRTTSYLIEGNDTSVNDFSGAVTTNHWYNIDGIDVIAPESAYSVAILGNSITGGRGSVPNMQNRWPDYLSNRLLANQATSQVGVLNMGIGGNCLLKPCLGPAGIDRYMGDIIEPAGVEAAIVFIGVNDIGGVGSSESSEEVANGLINAYKMMIKSAHANGIMIYGATITPFKGNGYYNEFSEACRQKVNHWIRYSDAFDAVLDFEKAVRDPQDTLRLISAYQNDGLHPDTAMYRLMVNSIDLSLFEGLDTLEPAVDTTALESLWIEPEDGTKEDNRNLSSSSRATTQAFIDVDEGLYNFTGTPAAETVHGSLAFEVSGNSAFSHNIKVSDKDTDAYALWLVLHSQNPAQDKT